MAWFYRRSANPPQVVKSTTSVKEKYSDYKFYLICIKCECNWREEDMTPIIKQFCESSNKVLDCFCCGKCGERKVALVTARYKIDERGEQIEGGRYLSPSSEKEYNDLKTLNNI